VVFDYIVAVSDDAQKSIRHYLRGRKYIDNVLPNIYNIDGTEEEKLEQYRQTRDQLKEWIQTEFGNGNK